MVSINFQEECQMNLWQEILDNLRTRMPEEDFRRWFGTTAYASDSGDQLTVWVPTEAIRRHIVAHYESAIEREMTELGRPGTHIRLVVSGMGEDEDDAD
jgi:chromosomal replication initiation ATPase DnaA